MVYCVAFNCNTRSGQGYWLLTFPKDMDTKAKVKRQNFLPTEHSRLCSKHFDFDQFVIDARIAASIFQGFSEGKVFSWSFGTESELTQVLDMSADDVHVEESESSCLSELEPHDLETSMPLPSCMTDNRQTFEMFSQTDNKIVNYLEVMPAANFVIPPELLGSNASSQLTTIQEDELSDSDDPEWVPSDEKEEIEGVIDINEQKNEAKERKFIAFKTELNDI
ncbi:unnamed protein product [Mytilus edulis]|uniref:THAP-type domain-containing protein n=1 Tax=Mytilus edulis TaxID=6550 RepID=A0A8S3SDF7_MYTED|nr:unnamed protein product [Mytilus edulis]